MRAIVVVVCGAALALGGCADKRAHTVCNGGVSGPVVAGATLFELDDYGDANQCDGADVADGTIAPLSTRTFAVGSAISLSLPPGKHTIVLRAFSDTGGANELGSGCTEVTLSAGGDFCFDVTLEPKPDDGGAGGGGGGGGGGSGSDGGSPPGDLGCTPVTHFDGLGDNWYDCVPLGTQDATQAYKAANAWDATGTISPMARNYSDSKGTLNYICDQSTARNACACWTWNTTGQYAPVGRALATGGKPTQCFIPFGSSFTAWQ
jgi:hypothetical protein